MPSTTSPPLFRRVPPEVWVGLAWCAAAAYPAVLLGSTARQYGGAAAHGGLAFTLADTAVAFTGAALVRRLPVLSVALLLIATWTETDGWAGGTQVPPAALLAVDAALCLITATQPRRTSRAAFTLVMVFLVLHIGLVRGNTVGIFTGTHIGSADGAALLALVAWLVGRSVRQNREHAEALSTRAAAEAVTAERLRIAREMHDTVAHSLGIVALQAGAARRVIDSRPERAKASLGEIEAAGRDTLAALRRMLVALRRADGEASATAPQGLADLDRLAEATTAAGVRVEVRRFGDQEPLPPEVDLAAFRIVQESVTNVVRHADVRACVVSVDRRTAGELSVEVTDRGRGHGTAPGSGVGLAGLRERVALLHGGFEAGPRPGGGFRVAATLPVPAAVPAAGAEARA
ncbi:sensor histidine kinase [Streptomyces sp. 1331.2]|uniref:sensor histidine kinase n=1 Tax=Streptomyces sp. 1331.2 TaxID=1938835 RepID=UPI000BDBEE22|nr:sensor histidine kinase [Streptomyces sp. 1331.2]SOB79384.1 Signal transduction histidine kinase [Streptomyces sp. 1331.2]